MHRVFKSNRNENANEGNATIATLNLDSDLNRGFEEQIA